MDDKKLNDTNTHTQNTHAHNIHKETYSYTWTWNSSLFQCVCVCIFAFYSLLVFACCYLEPQFYGSDHSNDDGKQSKLNRIFSLSSYIHIYYMKSVDCAFVFFCWKLNFERYAATSQSTYAFTLKYIYIHIKTIQIHVYSCSIDICCGSWAFGYVTVMNLFGNENEKNWHSREKIRIHIHDIHCKKMWLLIIFRWKSNAKCF